MLTPEKYFRRITKNDTVLLITSIVLCIIIFIYDIYTPAGWIEWVLYLIPLTIISFASKRRYILILSSISSVLIILGLALVPPPSNLDISIFIRLIGIIFFWIVTYEYTIRKKALYSLEESETRYRLLFENNPKPLFVYDINNLNILEVNSTALNRYGFPKDELLLMKITDLHATDEKNDMIQFYINKTDDVISLYNCSHITKNGSIMECDLTSLKLKFENHNARLVLVIDITDLKRTQKDLEKSLKEKEILLKEIHHRVKNNLQVVSSLLNIQSRYIKDPEALEYFKQSQSRVQVMSLIHEKLYKSEDFSSIDFEQYLKQLTASIYQSYHISSSKISMELQVNLKDLGIDIAIPCSLIVNELITNSFKYAFPDGRNGTIKIFLDKDGVDKKSLILTYADNGIGLPHGFDINKSDTLGMKLIKTLTGQLQGNMKIDNKDGTKVIITFPA